MTKTGLGPADLPSIDEKAPKETKQKKLDNSTALGLTEIVMIESFARPMGQKLHIQGGN